MKPTASIYQYWVLPEAFDRHRRLLEVRMQRRGRKEYIQILRLLENFSLVQVEQTVKQAMGLGMVDFDATKHLILCAIEQRPAKLDLTLYPICPVTVWNPPNHGCSQGSLKNLINLLM